MQWTYLGGEKRNFTVKYKGSALLLQIVGLTNLHLSEKNIITVHLQVLTRRSTSFCGLPLFYCHQINYYLSLRCQVFLNILASFLNEIMNFIVYAILANTLAFQSIMEVPSKTNTVLS